MTPVQRTKTIFIVFAFSLALAGAVYYATHRKTSQAPFGLTQESEFSKVLVQKDGSAFGLEQREGRWWVIDPFEDWAEESVVSSFLDAFQSLEIGTIISENPDRYAQFDVQDGTGKRVRVFLKGSDKPALDAFFGKRATSGYGSVYLRFPGEAAVRIGTEFPVYLLLRDGEDYRQVRPFYLEGENLASLTLTEKDKTYQLIKSSSAWTLAGAEEPVPAEEMNDFLVTLKNFRTQRTYEGKAKLKTPTFTFSAQTQDGKKSTMEVFNGLHENPKQSIIRIKNRPQILETPKSVPEPLRSQFPGLK